MDRDKCREDPKELRADNHRFGDATTSLAGTHLVGFQRSRVEAAAAGLPRLSDVHGQAVAAHLERELGGWQAPILKAGVRGTHMVTGLSQLQRPNPGRAYFIIISRRVSTPSGRVSL